MVKTTLDDKCKKALVELTKNMREVKKRLRQIENIEKDIDKKASYILETLSIKEDIKREYSGLSNFYDDTLWYEDE